MENWMKILAAVLAIIMLATAFAGCEDEGDDDGDDDGSYGYSEGSVEMPDFDAHLDVDYAGSHTNLTLEHRRGEKLVWADYEVRLGSETFTSLPKNEAGATMTESEIGDTVVFSATHGEYTVGEKYTVNIIERDRDIIVYEESVIAKQA